MEFIVVVVIAAIIIYSIMSYRKKIATGCCGASADEIKRVRIADKNTANYAYHTKIKIEGMTCSNCTKRVENALHAQEGVYARADLTAGAVDIYMKREYTQEELYGWIRDAGYFPYHYEKL